VELNYEIIHLQPGDTYIEDYRDLRIQLWPDSKNDCDREIKAMPANSARWAVFVALLAPRVIGFLEVSLRDYAEGASSSPVAYLEGWFVAPEYRRQGAGKALVMAAERWAMLRDCSEIASDTLLDNGVSIAAHEKLGYKEVERQICFLKHLKPLP